MAASDSDQKSVQYEEGPREEIQVHDAEKSRSPEESVDFPEGGLRAWSIAISTAMVLFCTLGSVNSFGYGLLQAVLSMPVY
jgi:hypothetical protein